MRYRNWTGGQGGIFSETPSECLEMSVFFPAWSTMSQSKRDNVVVQSNSVLTVVLDKNNEGLDFSIRSFE